MTILPNQSFGEKDFTTESFVTTSQLSRVIDGSAYKDDLLKLFGIKLDSSQVVQVGNSKQLLASLAELDSQCEKIDILSMMRNVRLETLLDAEKAIFHIYEVSDKSIIKRNQSDLLPVESRYSAKTDSLDYYHFSRFANYCRDFDFKDLISTIRDYLIKKDSNNEEVRKCRLVFHRKDEKYYLRAVTSSNDYKDYGINFSVFVALVALDRYVQSSKNEVFINRFVVDDSTIYVSFALKRKIKIDAGLSLSFNLILENDEIKRNAVSFNGVFQLEYHDGSKNSEVTLRPSGFIKEGSNYPTDLLTYPHRGDVSTVLDKISTLPKLIEYYIKQVSDDAKKVASIQSPNDVKNFIKEKVKNSKKPEIQQYKGKILNHLMKINVDNTYQLFELLRHVEELFDHDDIISRDFWRTKLYEALVERK